MPIAPATKLVSELALAVKRQFGDESGTQISDNDIIRWINQGQLSIAQQGEATRTTATTLSVAGQSTYNFPSDSILVLNAVFYDNIPLENYTFEQAQTSLLAEYGSTTQTATPFAWYEWENSINLFPIPDSSDVTIKIYCSKTPPTITSLSDNIGLPDTHYEVLLQYVLSQAYELDDDFNSAQIKANQSSAGLKELSLQASSRFYDVITIMEEDM